MSPENFCFWLQGRAELVKSPPTPEEWKSIVEHLQLVFHKVTPKVETNNTPPWTAPVTGPIWPAQPNWIPAPGVTDRPPPWAKPIVTC